MAVVLASLAGGLGPLLLAVLGSGVLDVLGPAPLRLALALALSHLRLL